MTRKIRYPVERKSAMGYTPETGELICEHLAELGSLRAVCRLPGMPSPATVHRWLTEDPEFTRAYARARAVGVMNEVDRATEIADAKMKPEDVPQARLRVEQRRWVAERMLPAVYGHKTALELSGGLEVKTMSPMERRQRIISILATASKRGESLPLVIEHDDPSDLA